ncbi:predicted protein [Sclerotinia sclerotiorum 1980 UF-70]|uniref:Yeast cell wall synthesis Kre9/Knh1 C-terminal domain-containing protein n=2 Tax=Sclerotinia sclerotiorum (strain ATCC 18683 / 1980 / Ss-1) TaxID=665079 RepID=A7EJ06_SCLS1|nr:predicted protein [Sclerotinia sclerotiorum 1980 UF-70]APA11800.1 hypothetical protein sscle_08g065700 [Sclerotinia sclerotiorum 1980 UF-70]EDO02822.1 predicted protein [Sclerotinia sclerotiorum 1980 UF-70]
MHITLTHSLFLLGIFVYSSAALVLQQTSRLSPTEGFQNSLGFSVDKGTAVSPTAVADFKQFVQTSLFAVPSSLASPDSEGPSPTSQPPSTVAIYRHDDAETDFVEYEHEQVNPRNLREGGFNIATWSPTAFALLPDLTPVETPTLLPLITANPTFSEEFMTPTTTFTTTVMYSTIYYTVRDVARGKSSTTIVPLSRAPPQTFMTITASPVLASGI